MAKIKVLSSIDVNKIISGSTCVASPMICGTSCLLIGSATSPQITTKLTGSTNIYLRSACSDPGITIYWNGTQGTRIDDNQVGIPSTSAPTFYVNNYTAGNGNVYISKTTGLTTIGGCAKLATVPACSASEPALFINGGGCIVSGTSSGGGINWDGTTANGIGTYVSSTCICSQPTLTYDGLNLQFANGQTRCVSMAAAPSSGSSHLYICGAPMSASGSAAGNVKIIAGCSTYSSAALGGVAALCAGSASSAASGIGQGGAVCVIAGCGYMGGTGVYACGGHSYLIAGSSCAPNFCSKGGCVYICGGYSTGSTYGSGGGIWLYAGCACTTSLAIETVTGGGAIQLRSGNARGLCGDSPNCYIVGGSLGLSAGCGCAISGQSYGGGIDMYAGNAYGNTFDTCGGSVCIIGGSGYGCGGNIQFWAGCATCLCDGGCVLFRAGCSKQAIGGPIYICAGQSCSSTCAAGSVWICGGRNECASGAGNSGGINLIGGITNNDGDGGSIVLSGGCSNGNYGGNIILSPGISADNITKYGHVIINNLQAKTSETSILYVNSTGSILSGTSSGGGALSGLTDVNIVSPAAGDVLTYTGASGWANCTPVDITANLSTGDLLYYNGTTISGATFNQASAANTTFRGNVLLLCSNLNKCIKTCDSASYVCTLNICGGNTTGTTNGCCGGCINIAAGIGCRTSTTSSNIYGGTLSLSAGAAYQCYNAIGGYACGGCISIIAGLACNCYDYPSCGGNIDIYAGCSYAPSPYTYTYGGDITLCAGGGCCCGGCVVISAGYSSKATIPAYHGNIYMCRLKSTTCTTCVVIDAAGCISCRPAASDCRLKCNLHEITGMTSLLNTANAYSIEFYNTNTILDGLCQYALIAQDIENCLPLAVKNEAIFNDTEYKVIDYQQIIPVLWSIAKEQQAQICCLQNEINVLKNCF